MADHEEFKRDMERIDKSLREIRSDMDDMLRKSAELLKELGLDDPADSPA